MAEPFDVFLSYSRADNLPLTPGGPGRVDLLLEAISAHQAGTARPLRLFFDRADIRDYDDWRHRILESLRQSSVLLVVLSPNYLASAACRWEWEHFLQRQGPRDLGGDGVRIASVCLAIVEESPHGERRARQNRS